MKCELQEAIRELEGALLGLKKKRLMESLGLAEVLVITDSLS